MTNDNLLTYMQEHQSDFLSMLQKLIELESPSHEDKAASDQCSRFLAEAFSGLGFHITPIHQKACGDHVYGELGQGSGGLLIVGHYDTVFPMGTIKNMPFQVEDKKARGPGVLDMKGGIVMAYWAVKALLEQKKLPQKRIGIFFNGDEESGSFYSSDQIVEKARSYDGVLVMEPGVNDINSLKIHRYGRGTYRVIAHGTAAHSGSNSHLAVSPLTEIAHQLLRIEDWNREIKDVTFAPTLVSGGVPGTCMVPDKAEFTMDVRFRTEELAKQIHEKIMKLQPVNPNIRLEVQGKVDKPVMIADPALYKKAVAIGHDYGLELTGIAIGGGSDGNFTAAAGIPTLDGLGTTGEFLHNSKEYIHLDHVPVRTAVLARLLQSV